ncbi:MAG: DsbA family protein [Rhodospirillales bacterium]|nr:DsbA family protein [Rhodospirillales bacterium]MCW9039264.1 DsbA family protein [Rhodospirillales bacterium]
MTFSRIFTYAFMLPLTVALLFNAPTAKAADGLSTSEQEQVRELVRETLMKNPEIIMEAIGILRQKQEAMEKARVETAMEGAKNDLLNDPDSPVGGNPKGDVTIVEFFDYKCGYCKKVFPEIMALIESDKGIRYVFKEFPILGPESELASRAALAASLQGKYLDLHVGMMNLRGSVTSKRIADLAREFGIDFTRLEKDMASPEVTAMINRNRALAQHLGISGTPAFIIGGEIIPGAVDQATLKHLVEQARKNKG